MGCVCVRANPFTVSATFCAVVPSSPTKAVIGHQKNFPFMIRIEHQTENLPDTQHTSMPTYPTLGLLLTRDKEDC
jgi:hypothetical protein